LAIKNLRSVAAQNINASYQINGGTIQNGTLANLNASATATLNFTQRADLSADGIYVIKAWVSDAEDLDRSNDTITVTIVNQAKPDASFASVAGTNGAFTFNNTTKSDVTATYAWNFGDGATSTNENPSHSYTQSGTYTVTMIATNACGVDTATETNTVVVSGVALQANEKYVRAYPNPNNGTFAIDLRLTKSDNITINVFNANGQLVHTQALGLISQENVNLDLSTLTPGVYNVSIHGTNTQIVKRVNIIK
jgi:PKD repeat protein